MYMSRFDHLALPMYFRIAAERVPSVMIPVLYLADW